MSAGAQVDCEAEFVRIMEGVDHYPDVARRTRRMEALAPQCESTGIYEARLGYFYAQAGRYDEARRTVQRGLASKTEHERELRLALSNIHFRQGKLAESEREALTLIERFPDWQGGYLSLGETRLVQRRFQEGIDNLERATAIEPGSGAYALLAMAYHQVGRPRDSAKAMQQALRLDIGALKNTQAVCATAHSLVTLGHLTEAEDLLVKHLQVQPKAAGDSTYKAAKGRVREALNASKKSTVAGKDLTEGGLQEKP